MKFAQSALFTLAAVLAVCDADGAPALVLRSARPSFLMTICLPSFVR